MVLHTWVRRNSAGDDSGTLGPVDEEQSCSDSDGEGTSGEHCDCVSELCNLEVKAGEWLLMLFFVGWRGLL